MRKTYEIKGMTCQSCVKKVTAALEPLVARVSVTLNPPQAELEGDTLPELASLNAALPPGGKYILSETSAPTSNWFRTYYPLLLIITLISLVSLAGDGWMLNFMAGFFLAFGAFKLLDPTGFRDAYATYDLLAKRWPAYGLLYPVLELALGFAFLFRFELTATLWLSILLMSFSSLGVIQALRDKRQIRCACLGTALNLPMSTITLIEDLGMVAMSAAMLAMA